LSLDLGDVSFFNKNNCFLLIIYTFFARYKELFAYFCGVKKKKIFIRKIGFIFFVNFTLHPVSNLFFQLIFCV
jgi:hypothetical protein